MKKLPENFSTDLWQKVIDGNRKIFESVDGNSLVSSLENFFLPPMVGQNKRLFIHGWFFRLIYYFQELHRVRRCKVNFVKKWTGLKVTSDGQTREY